MTDAPTYAPPSPWRTRGGGPHYHSRAAAEGEDGEEPSVFVRWNFAWHRRYRGDQLLAEETGDWRVTYVAIGHRVPAA
ncbi:hypothetical protein ACFV9E_35270 [Streptomyces sp. NPDC059835]|uniref:hypothetical protein n=1 Tax=Streptomyces sp. NPDC059835 TaxID=3346967 RepID=UPI0036646DA5